MRDCSESSENGYKVPLSTTQNLRQVNFDFLFNSTHFSEFYGGTTFYTTYRTGTLVGVLNKLVKTNVSLPYG